MNKYDVEGGIDFFSQLKQSLNHEDQDNSDELVCLISNEPLTNTFVTMLCGHKFNYLPLYHDLVNHKKKYNNMENSVGKLGVNQIRCPYCRQKQTTLLEFYEDLGLPKVNGVNWYNPNSKHNGQCQCEYLFPNPQYNSLAEISETNNPYITSTICETVATVTIPLIYGDTHHYCYKHKQLMLKKYKQQALELKQAKALEKKALKASAQEAKLQAKQAKQQATENVVLGLHGCVHLLKSGPNKGHPCGCKTTPATGHLCKRHAPKA